MKKEYLELTRTIERLYRRYLEVLRAELNRLGVTDINAVQALLLSNIGPEEIAIRELMDRGYYLGSNVSYNIKKLTEAGFLQQKRSQHDRRSINVRLTPRALELTRRLREMEEHHALSVADAGVEIKAIEDAMVVMKKLERSWTDYIHYGPED